MHPSFGFVICEFFQEHVRLGLGVFKASGLESGNLLVCKISSKSSLQKKLISLPSWHLSGEFPDFLSTTLVVHRQVYPQNEELQGPYKKAFSTLWCLLEDSGWLLKQPGAEIPEVWLLLSGAILMQDWFRSSWIIYYSRSKDDATNLILTLWVILGRWMTNQANQIWKSDSVEGLVISSRIF